ncbi:MAG: thioredoxin family protein [Planctomycetaceae bacterium]|jgi:thiol-disulfide isomerase/thioredoxin|nr:thioredoxin family protein [Planctomycetaceae bacterium]
MTINFKSIVAVAIAAALIAGCKAKVQPATPSNSPSVTDGSTFNDTNVTPGTVNWQTDIEAAKKLSAENGKPIFALFTGQSWCPPCMMLEKEVLNSTEFSDFITENTVPAKFVIPADWHRNNANVKLIAKYMGQQCYVPCIYLLDANGTIITQYELQQDSYVPKNFVAGLKTIIDKIQASKSVAQDTTAL